MVGASFTVAAVAQVLRSKKGISAVGNAQVDTAQSKFGGASLLLDGTGDYLLIRPLTEFAFGTNNFTIEFWLRVTTISTQYQNILDMRTAGNQFAPVIFLEYGVLKFGDGYTVRITNGSNLSINTWYHVAVSRSATSTKMFVDGTQVGSTYSDSANYIAPDFAIGANFAGAASVNGHMDEVRISNSARYTTTFTPSTSAFVNDANTLLLIHANGTDASTFFEDDNGVRAQKGITAVGNAQVDTAQSKFGGASLLLDDSPEAYLTVAHTSDMATGTGAFTAEGWFRPQLAGDPGQGFGTRFWFFKGVNSATGFGLGVTTDGVRFRGPGTTDLAYNTTISSSVFTHIAFVWDGANKKIYLNGTSVASASASLNVTDTTNYQIGYFTGIFAYNGWIDEIRVSNSARYTTTFTPSTTPFVNDANTLLLIHADGTNASTVVRDDNGANGKNITANGDAKISTAQSKFGGSSALFDGSSDRLIITSDGSFAYAGDFTVEAWVRPASFGNAIVLFSQGSAEASMIAIYAAQSTGQLIYYAYSNNRITGSNLTLNTWHHIAVSRSGSSIKLFLDGTQVGSTYTDTTSIVDAPFYVGSWINNTSSWNGYIDEVRVSNTARYTAGFTAPTAAFVNDANTLLLLHMDGANNSTAFIDSASRSQKGVIAVGSAGLSTTRSYFGGSSAYFNNYMVIPEHIRFNPGVDFTIEFWVNEDTIQNCKYIGGQTSGDIFIGHETTQFSNRLGVGVVGFGWYADLGVTLAADTWYNIAISRTGTTVRYFVDGDLKLTQTSGVLPESTWLWTGMELGSQTGGVTPFNGYIDELRVSQVCRYTAGFTVSTAPFQNDANTVLLLHFDGTNGSKTVTDDNGIAPYTP
jgi:hypothetical protein